MTDILHKKSIIKSTLESQNGGKMTNNIKCNTCFISVSICHENIGENNIFMSGNRRERATLLLTLTILIDIRKCILGKIFSGHLEFGSNNG